MTCLFLEVWGGLVADPGRLAEEIGRLVGRPGRRHDRLFRCGHVATVFYSGVRVP